MVLTTKTSTKINTKAKILTTVLALGIIAVAAAGMMMRRQEQQGLQFLENTRFNFGSVEMGKEVSRVFVLRNNSRDKSIKFSIKENYSGFSINKESTTCTGLLAAERTCEIEMVFSPDRKKKYKDYLTIFYLKDLKKKYIKKRVIGIGLYKQADPFVDQVGWSWKKDANQYKYPTSDGQLLVKGNGTEEEYEVTLPLAGSCVDGRGKFIVKAEWDNDEERVLKFWSQWYMVGAGETGIGTNKLQLLATDGFIVEWEKEYFENNCNEWDLKILRGAGTTPTSIYYEVWFYPSNE